MGSPRASAQERVFRHLPTKARAMWELIEEDGEVSLSTLATTMSLKPGTVKSYLQVLVGTSLLRLESSVYRKGSGSFSDVADALETSLQDCPTFSHGARVWMSGTISEVRTAIFGTGHLCRVIMLDVDDLRVEQGQRYIEMSPLMLCEGQGRVSRDEVFSVEMTDVGRKAICTAGQGKFLYLRAITLL